VEEALFYKEIDSTLYMRAKGHITAVLCADLKSRVFERLSEKPAPSAILIDLAECSYMDSTFMGLIVGINKQFLALSGKPLTIVKPSPVSKGLLKTLGITRLVTITEESPHFPAAMDDIGMKQKATAEFLLDAHENLIELSEENKNRFAVLRTVLKNRTEGGEGKPEGTGG
jgi:anti-anti-sigma factor